MALHIHIHRPTKDAGWDESKHPRKEDGKFGSGGASKGAKIDTSTPAGQRLASGLLRQANEAPASQTPAAGAQGMLGKVDEARAIAIGAKATPEQRAAYSKLKEQYESKHGAYKPPGARQAAATQKADKAGEQKALADLKAHPMYAKEDFEYLTDKGYSAAEIKALWDRDHKAGKQPLHSNKNSESNQADLRLIRQAMSGKRPGEK